MPRLYKILVEERLVRSRTEAERLIRQGAISVGGCSPECSFFTTGDCSCNGWRKVLKPTEEIEIGLAVKVGNGRWRVMNRLDGPGYDLVNGIGRCRAEHETIPTPKPESS